MNLKESLISLSHADGASGFENEAAEAALKMLKGFCPDAEIISGNVIGHLGDFSENKPSLLLDAHIDQVGLIVTYITDDGFVKFGSLGGIDRRLLPAQQVVIHGNKPIKGVICSVPPHLSNGGENIPKIEDLAIDCGYSKSELEKLISIGDCVTFDVQCRQLLGSRITGRAFDDRCGIVSILHALELLQNEELRYNVTVLFSTQEELGERGAKIGAYVINPDIAIAVDVSFGYAQGETDYKCGFLGKGPMIGISPSLSREIYDQLISAAETANIPYQIEVMNGLTSTNCDRFVVNREGAKGCTVSIPLRYMHTPVEVIDLKDVELTGKLLAQFIKEDQQ